MRKEETKPCTCASREVKEQYLWSWAHPLVLKLSTRHRWGIAYQCCLQQTQNPSLHSSNPKSETLIRWDAIPALVRRSCKPSEHQLHLSPYCSRLCRMFLVQLAAVKELDRSYFKEILSFAIYPRVA